LYAGTTTATVIPLYIVPLGIPGFVVEKLPGGLPLRAAARVGDRVVDPVLETRVVLPPQAGVGQYLDSRREFVDGWGLGLDYRPEGAYYALADVSDLPGDAVEVADLFLEEAGVAVTPGVDFGDAASDYLRLSYATSIEAIDEAGRRVRELLATVE